MQTPDSPQFPRQTDDDAPRGHRRAMLVGVLKVALPLAILVGGGGLALGLMATGPTADRKPPVREARLVEVTPVTFEKTHITVDAMGTVGPDRQVELRPRVGGQVVWISDNYVPGGVLEKGEPLLKIDPKDYELVVQQKAAAVAKADSELRIEKGQQVIAQREYELLGQTVKPEDRALVLRQPQLAQVEADLETAKAELAQARLDLARTEVSTPFNAVIQSRDVNLGTQVTTTTTVATLVGTDAYLIEVAVPVNQLRWIEIPRTHDDAGAVVRVYNESAWGKGVSRTGHVVRLASQLESEGRMAQLLVSVDDPLALMDENEGAPVLLIGAYIRVQIEGSEVGPVAAMERKYLRDGNTVWIMTPDGELEIRPVDILFRGPDTVLIRSGLQAGDRIITTSLSTPIEGLALRVRDDRPVAAGEGRKGRRSPDTGATR